MLLAMLAVLACRSSSDGRLPQPPVEPGIRMQTVEEALADDLIATTYWAGGVPRSLRGATLAVLEFAGEAGTAEATAGLRERLEQVPTLVGEDRTEALAAELGLREADLAGVEAALRVRAASDPPAADYLLFAEITGYAVEETAVAVGAVFEPGEIERYEAEYEVFVKTMNVTINRFEQEHQRRGRRVVPASPRPGDLGGVDTIEEEQILARSHELQATAEDLLEQTISPDGYRERAAGLNREETAPVARVAVEARLVDVRAGETAWIYSGRIHALDLETGLDRLLDDLVAGMMEG